MLSMLVRTLAAGVAVSSKGHSGVERAASCPQEKSPLLCQEH